MSHPTNTAKEDTSQSKIMEKPPNQSTSNEPDIPLSKCTNQQPQNLKRVVVKKICVKDLPKLKIIGISKVGTTQIQNTNKLVDSNGNTFPLPVKNLPEQNQQEIQRTNTGNLDKQNPSKNKNVEAQPQNNAEPTTLKKNEVAKQIVAPPPTVCVPPPNFSNLIELNQPENQEKQTADLDNLLKSKNNVAATQKNHTAATPENVEAEPPTRYLALTPQNIGEHPLTRYLAFTPQNVGTEALTRDLALTPQNIGAEALTRDLALTPQNVGAEAPTRYLALTPQNIGEHPLTRYLAFTPQNVGAEALTKDLALPPQNLNAATTKIGWTPAPENIEASTPCYDYAPTPKHVQTAKCDVATTQNNIGALTPNDYKPMKSTPQNMPFKVYSTPVKAKEPLLMPALGLDMQNPEIRHMPIISLTDSSTAQCSKFNYQVLSKETQQVSQKRNIPAIMKRRASLMRKNEGLSKRLQPEPNSVCTAMNPKLTTIKPDGNTIMPHRKLLKPRPKIIDPGLRSITSAPKTMQSPKIIRPDPKSIIPDPKTMQSPKIIGADPKSIIPAPKTMQSPNIIGPDPKSIIQALNTMQNPEIIGPDLTSIIPPPKTMQNPELIGHDQTSIIPPPKAMQNPELIGQDLTSIIPPPKTMQNPEIIGPDPKSIIPAPNTMQNPEIIGPDLTSIIPPPKTMQNPEIIEPDLTSIIPPKTMQSPKKTRPVLKTQIGVITLAGEPEPAIYIQNEDKGVKRVTEKRKRIRKRAGSKPTPRIPNMYIAEGFSEDCEILIEKCLEVYKLDFDKFSEIWKTMNLHQIYQDRKSGAELAELSEEVLQVAKYHMVAKGVKYEENVAGLFLVYAFQHLQPYEGFAALRLTPNDVPSIKSLEMTARMQKRQDVLYILGKVLIYGPCQFHVLSREVGLELSIRKYFDGSVHVPRPYSGGYFKKGCEMFHSLNTLIETDRQYAESKKKLINGPDREQNLTASVQPAAEMAKRFRRWMATVSNTDGNTSETEQTTPEQERHVMIKSIKDKAMGNVVDPMKHLTGVCERQQLNRSTLSDTIEQAETETPPAPYKGRSKGKGKGKGRMSSKTLHDLFEGTADVKPEESLNETSPEPVELTSPNTTDVVDITGNIAVPHMSCHVQYIKSKSYEIEDANANRKLQSKLKLVETKEPKRKQNLKPFRNLCDSYESSEITLGTSCYDVPVSDPSNNSVINIDATPFELYNVDDNVEMPVLDCFPQTKQATNVNRNIDDSNQSDSDGETSVRFVPNKPKATINLDEIQCRKKTKEKRELKRVRMKSKFKKLGILRVANFKGKEVELSDGDDI